MRFAVFLCYSVRYLHVFLCGFAVLVPPLRPLPESVVFPLRSDSFFWKITDKNIKRIGSQQWFPQHQKKPVKIHSETLRFCLCLKLVVNLMNFTSVSHKMQTAADHCLHHANENVTTIIPLFCNTENNGLQSAFCTVQIPKIPKISPGAYIFQRPFLKGLFLEGLVFDWASLIPGRKFAVFL